MEECRKIRELIVGNHYGEDENTMVKSHLEICSQCREFAESIDASLKNMDILNIDIPVIYSDIDKVLDKAEEIQGRRKMRIDTGVFAFTALLILTAFSLLALRLGPSFLVITQVIIGMNLPLVLLAARKLRVKEVEVR